MFSWIQRIRLDQHHSNSTEAVGSTSSSPLLIHLQFQPSHFPVAFPLAWQSSLQVDSAAHRANSVGLRKAVSHSQSNKPSFFVQIPVFLPIELQVPSQNESPRLHLEGRSAFKFFKLIDFSLQWQVPSSSQTPEVCPSSTHPAVQTGFPKVHLKPALATEKTVVQTNPNKRNLFIVIAELWSDMRKLFGYVFTQRETIHN